MHRMGISAKLAVIFIASIVLAGCASNPQAMVVSEQSTDPFPKNVRGRFFVGSAIGGGDNNFWVGAGVDAQSFRQALELSMEAAGLVGPARDLRVDVVLSDIKRPMIAMDVTLTLTVEYVVTDVQSGEVLFSEGITEPYTQTFGSSLIAANRLKLASEGVVKKNIATFLERLRQSF